EGLADLVVAALATEPGTGNNYMLDSGLNKGPNTYVVGMFSTPCLQSPTGAVQFGEIRNGLEEVPAFQPSVVDDGSAGGSGD
ncbi:MAG: hypothetical protein ACTH0Y_12110, partial [Luteimonas sp.]